METDSVTWTTDAARSARERVGTYAAQAARDERAAARFAGAALFEEALLGALRAQFAELRTVSK